MFRPATFKVRPNLLASRVAFVPLVAETGFDFLKIFKALRPAGRLAIPDLPHWIFKVLCPKTDKSDPFEVLLMQFIASSISQPYPLRMLQYRFLIFYFFLLFLLQ